MRDYILATMLIVLGLLVIGYAVYESNGATPARAPLTLAQPLPTVSAGIAPPAVLTPTLMATAIPGRRDLQENYCFWPGDTVSDVARAANADLDAVHELNPNFTGFAGATLHLPVGSVPPAEWSQPRPVINHIGELPFGVSGYYLSADNRQKRVALTFDIGYVPENKVLMKLLADRGIRATFFVVGESMAKHPEVIVDLLAYNHELANHSWTHENMQGMSEAAIVAELQQTEAAVQAAHPGATTKPFFRAPFGAITPAMVKIAAHEGYHTVGWTVDSSDWTENVTADIVYRRVTQNVCPGAIVVMHDVNPANFPALPKILDFLDSQGYRYVALSEILLPQ